MEGRGTAEGAGAAPWAAAASRTRQWSAAIMGDPPARRPGSLPAQPFTPTSRAWPTIWEAPLLKLSVAVTWWVWFLGVGVGRADEASQAE